jgi:hypothetical protein
MYEQEQRMKKRMGRVACLMVVLGALSGCATQSGYVPGTRLPWPPFSGTSAPGTQSLDPLLMWHLMNPPAPVARPLSCSTSCYFGTCYTNCY